MIFPIETGDAPLLRGNRRLTERGFLPPWMALPFVAGLVLGSLIGLLSSIPACVSSLYEADLYGRGFLYALWKGSRFSLTALLLSTSFLGFVFVPALSALYGFILSCSISAVLRAEGYSGLLAAFVSYGFPALLGLPAFLLAASDGAWCSLQLLRCFSRGERPLPANRGDFPRHLALIVFLCVAEALYSAFLLPVILNAVR